MAYVAIAAARVALGLETARHGYGKLNHWPEFATMIRFEGPWGPPVLPQLNTLPTAATEAVAITSTVVQLGGGVAIAGGVGVRYACLVQSVMMAVACHWQVVARGKSAVALFATDCDGKGLGPGYFVLGYGTFIVLGDGPFSLRSLFR
jgi:uncharacterized membrane protein YphA (DoxX/SURF4 family)